MISILERFILKPVARVPKQTENRTRNIKRKLIMRHAEGNISLAQGKFTLRASK